ncbi:MAG: NAD-dependent epimerase/dehydratase family protein [Bacteroidetes bacterium]|nr:NAD-dependent epimerase/dehydratase family protein [Bacteroidota bacterium]
MQSVIVIGGSGYLGSAVTRQLRDKGYKIYAVQNKSIIESKDDISIIAGGIKGLTAKRISEINPAAIFHCARPTFPYFRKLGRSIAAYKASKLNSYLLRQIEKSGIIAPLLFASGSLTYGNSKNAHDEQSPLAPISYARQYLSGELPIVRASKKKHSRSCASFSMVVGQWFMVFMVLSKKYS